MNATPTNLTPAHAAQAQPTAGRPADAAASDTPFSQVLSGEIARKGSATRESRERAADEAALQQAAEIGVATELVPLASTEATIEPASLATDEAATGLALLAAVEAATELTQPATDEALQEADDTQAGGPSALPDALLGLAAPSEWPKPVPTVQTAPADTAADPLDGLAAAQAARAGLAVAQDAPPAAAAAIADTTQARPIVAPQADTPPASPVAAAATAFSEKLAAARQSDPANAGERVAELLNHPGMRTAVHAAAAEAVSAPADPSASRLAPAVGTPAWGQALGDRLVWMAAGAQQTASLTLNPPNLGPLQVVLNVSNDQATASFYAVQPEVRQALESALPRLREMMSDAGIQLGQATVSADTPRQNDTPDRQAQRLAPEFLGAASANANPTAQTGMAAPVPRAGRGLVDTFA